MAKYILRRLVYIVFVFLIISVIQFLIYKAVPGDPARMMVEGGKNSMKPERYEQLYQEARQKLGLDKPLVIQYISWMGNILKFDFGYSITAQKPVIEAIKVPMQNTIQLNILSIFFILLITIPLGIATAVKKNTVFDATVQVSTIIGYSLPMFIFAILFIFVFSVKLNLLPISGGATPNLSGGAMTIFLDRLKYMILPTMAIVFASLGSMTRYIRAAMIDSLSMDYIRTARAKGLKEKVVIYSHAFRNSLIPVVTTMTMLILSIFGGSVVIERLFAWNGMGALLIDSLFQQDFAVVLALNMFYVVLALAGNLIMDILYCVVDPRVKLS